ncbi:MAG: hypothetical protein ABIK44_04900 [candidate division WOR-3 bacterium]
MQWFDWMSLAIVLGVAIIQTIRGQKAGGMGLPLFEGIGLVAAAALSTTLANGISQAIGISKPVVLLVLFLVFGILAFVFGRWLFGLTGWSFQSLDGFFSFVFGFAAGWAIAHMVLRIIIESQGMNGALATAIPNAPIAREVYTFRTWNALLNLLFKAKLGPDFNPDIG